MGADVLDLTTREGPRAVELAEQTQERSPRGDIAGVEALEPDLAVEVFGHPGLEGKSR